MKNWYATVWSPGGLQPLPLFEIRGNQVFRSPWHPEGMSPFPILETRDGG